MSSYLVLSDFRNNKNSKSSKKKDKIAIGQYPASLHEKISCLLVMWIRQYKLNSRCSINVYELSAFLR